MDAVRILGMIAAVRARLSLGSVRAALRACATGVAVLLCGVSVQAAEFGSKGGPVPANVDEVLSLLRDDPFDLELLISFGTSKGGSAGHLALAIRDAARGDERVYSANFYADRETEHAQHFHTDALMLELPKAEYLYGTTSSLGDKASFGLDFGEIYKRAVVGVRVFGVPAHEKQALAAFFERLNADYRQRARYTDYHGGEVKYGYLNLNCAKTIGMAFKLGAGYDTLDVKNVSLLLGTRAAAALTANIPTEMAMKLLQAWHARGYGLDVVLYKKYEGSAWVDPHDEEPVAFKNLPNRFPSVLSRDFLKEQGHYEDFDNLYAMYLLYNLGKHSVRIDASTGLLQVEKSKNPMSYAQATELAALSARADSDGFGRRQAFRPRGTAVGQVADNTHLYDFSESGPQRAASK